MSGASCLTFRSLHVGVVPAVAQAARPWLCIAETLI
jgi:hypothetical protein